MSGHRTLCANLVADLHVESIRRHLATFPTFLSVFCGVLICCCVLNGRDDGDRGRLTRLGGEVRIFRRLPHHTGAGQSSSTLPCVSRKRLASLRCPMGCRSARTELWKPGESKDCPASTTWSAGISLDSLTIEGEGLSALMTVLESRSEAFGSRCVVLIGKAQSEGATDACSSAYIWRRLLP